MCAASSTTSECMRLWLQVLPLFPEPLLQRMLSANTGEWAGWEADTTDACRRVDCTCVYARTFKVYPDELERFLGKIEAAEVSVRDHSLLQLKLGELVCATAQSQGACTT